MLLTTGASVAAAYGFALTLKAESLNPSQSESAFSLETALTQAACRSCSLSPQASRSGWVRPGLLSAPRSRASSTPTLWRFLSRPLPPSGKIAPEDAVAPILTAMTVVHRPRLLSDNGASYVAADLAQWLDRREIEHVRGAPYRPQTQGKIERWHQTLKNRILLEHYYLPGDLERQASAFVAHYNHARFHESLDNLTPADVYFGRAEAVLLERERIKRQTIANRRLQHQLHAA